MAASYSAHPMADNPTDADDDSNIVVNTPNTGQKRQRLYMNYRQSSRDRWGEGGGSGYFEVGEKKK